MSAGLLEKQRRIEYGDFQTPADLAHAVCRALRGEQPQALIEPTCGTGVFLAAALDCFATLRVALGVEINPRYVSAARRATAQHTSAAACQLRRGNFFELDWPVLLADFPEPLLILGNPPWVTNATLGTLGGGNLPPKQNLPGRSGLEGLTGKSNFDLSEWMIFQLLQAMAGRRATLAMLCKTAVARRLLARAWETRLPLQSSEIRAIDAAQHFGARVEACLLICRTGNDRIPSPLCRIYKNVKSAHCRRTFGWRDGRLVADVLAYERARGLLGGQSRWRSGIKHDCSAVFEFCEQPDGRLANGLGDVVELEPDYLFPLVKSSDIAAGRPGASRRSVLVPQRRVGEATDAIARAAPRTWRYLLKHAKRLDRRASRVYQKQPRFSIFGVGPYTFAPWKVAVSGFYKAPSFAAVGPLRGRPVVCDDTCYFLPCSGAAEARSLAELLNGPHAREFFSAFVFTDSKRPLTAEILGLLNLTALKTAAHSAPRRFD